MLFRSHPGYMVDQYEALRKHALETDSASHRGQGFVLFLARGMPGWLAALAVVAPSAERPCGPSQSGGLLGKPNLPSSVQSDFTSVLTDMVLALHPEATT
jgi:hypothetical protein